MKILLVTEVFPPEIGGVGALLYSLAVSTPETFDVLASEPPEGLAEQDAVDMRGGRLIRVPRFFHVIRWLRAGRVRGLLQRLDNGLLLRPRVWREVLRKVNFSSYDAVCIGHGLSCHWLLPRIRKLWPAMPVLLYAHGEEITFPPGGRPSEFARQVLNFDGYVAVSAYTRGKLRELGVPEDRIRTLNPGVDLERFHPGPPPQELVERYGLEGRKVLLTLARLDLRKGHDQVLRALPAIARAVPEVVYLIVGDGEHRAALEALTAELGVGDRVVFAGAIADREVVEFYRLCDVFAMPNRALKADNEGFGMVFLEANACGKPVVGGLAGGVPDAIEDGVTGLLVDGESVAAVEAGIVRLFTEPGLADALGRQGRERAERMAWPSQARRIVEAMTELVAGSRGNKTTRGNGGSEAREGLRSKANAESSGYAE